MHYKKTEATS